MSNLLNICGIIIASSQYPDGTLQQFYRQYYHCEIKSEQTKTEVQSMNDLSMFFPSQDTWWPIFTIDQISSDSFQGLIHKGIKPGIILPDEVFSFSHYFLLKEAVSQGAIPIVLFKSEQPQYFAAKATFSTAIGLRPMAAFVSTGWDENLISQTAGSYIVKFNLKELPLPSREIKQKQHLFYSAKNFNGHVSGYEIIINPPADLPTTNIRYPQLGISWKFNNIKYISTPEHVNTSFFGYIFIGLSTVVVPLDLILTTTYPDLLGTFGSYISWISLVIGVILLLLLISSIIRRVKSNGSH
ncbi:MAG TPA: hypothetical protein DEF26_18345 [Acinetobacter sp.]|uniref:hypothetical protein n=1 Tax=Acinetobacter oleivorans TaxID=1148157 RepID=UPI000E8C9FFA|nr:hypothetical protein [Acinetobacter oleivorans]MDY7372516.1 hypothetical protein [Acinetobacter oleivorans]HBU89570.1 hypothetical protein [Acinetobacter sp.]